MLMRSALDVDAVLEKNVGGPQDLLAGIDRIGEVVKAAMRAIVIAGKRQIVRLVRDRHPRPGLHAAVEHNHFRGPHADHILEKKPQLGDIRRQDVQMIEPPWWPLSVMPRMSTKK